MTGWSGSGGLPPAFLAAGSSSFSVFLGAAAPELLPGRRSTGGAEDVADLAPHGTTIVALRYADGVVMAGDRRATMGNVIAQRDIEPVGDPAARQPAPGDAGPGRRTAARRLRPR